MIKAKISITTLIICCVLVFAGTFATSKYCKSKNSKTSVTSVIDCGVKMEQIRLENYKHIQPLILANVNSESAALKSIRLKVEQYISEIKSSQKLEEVSVYFRRMEGGDWFSINPNVVYNPASMIKIIYLLTYLKDAEYNPEVLNKKIFFTKHFSVGNNQNIKNFSLNENQSYPAKELLSYMIKYSDNDATLLLSQNMNAQIYNQVFRDLQIPIPAGFGEYFISVIDYSKFFRVLFNASYIRAEYSEYALSLLTQSTFNDGIRKSIDPSIEVAHKFGERIIGNKAQFHEFGIVYIKDDPYLIGVMSKGNSIPQLTNIVSEISRITFQEYSLKIAS